MRDIGGMGGLMDFGRNCYGLDNFLVDLHSDGHMFVHET